MGLDERTQTFTRQEQLLCQWEEKCTQQVDANMSRQDQGVYYLTRGIRCRCRIKP